MHFDHVSKTIEVQNDLGQYMDHESGSDHHVYRSPTADCKSEHTGDFLQRYTEVTLECCSEQQFSAAASVPNRSSDEMRTNTFISSVTEPVPCSYYVAVCSQHVCPSGYIHQKQKKNWRKQKIDRNREQRIRKRGALNPPQEPVPQEQRQEKQQQQQQQQELQHQELARRKQELKEKQKPKNRQKTKKSPEPKTEQPKTAPNSHHRRVPGKDMPIPDKQEQRDLKQRVLTMFYHGYDSYMHHAFPEAELRPISCDGGQFELVKIPLVTLIDTLDTLVVIGNFSEFRRAVNLVSSHFPSFDLDVNVSVFETTIRVLGGLLSAHLMAIDPLLQIYDNIHRYDGWLLVLATDLGNRLLPAFRTNTGIPYGTVNLRSGVPKGETEIASTAGAGSLIVEFEALSSLTNDRRFGDAAYAAAQGLFDRRSPIGLLGKHIHTKTGRWFESVSGIGSNSDSFYEYLLKAFLLYRRQKMFRMFADTFSAIKRFVQVGDWFNDVDMFNGKLRRNRMENLAAFWPGMEATLGFSADSSRQLNTFYAVWADLGFLPEEFDNVQWQNGIQGGPQSMNAFYPLRPELIESTYHHYRATGDRSWLIAGRVFLESLENHTRTECGYASVTMAPNPPHVGSNGGMELVDTMPSFFLTETCKYLYLLFDEHNSVHDRAYIFSTEAHLFDPLQLQTVARSEEEEEEEEELLAWSRRQIEADDQDVTPQENELALQELGETTLLPSKCPKQHWWDPMNSYNANFFRPAASSEAVPPAKKAPGQSEKPRISTTKNKQPSPFPSMAPKNEDDAVRDHDAETKNGWKSNMKEWAKKKKSSIPFAQKILPLFGLNDEHAGDEVPDEQVGDRSDKDATQEGDNLSQEGQIGNSAAFKRDLQQRSVVSVLETTATQALHLEQRRDLSQLHASLHGYEAHPPDFSIVGALPGGGRPRRAEACYPEDEPISEEGSEEDGSSSGKSSRPLQAIEVNMGALGEFKVQVFSDGFIVRSKVWGDTLEISNVGQPVMFVRDSNSDSVKTVIGSVDGRVVSCSIAIDSTKFQPGWERACSVAAFGPVSTPAPIVAELSLGGSSDSDVGDVAALDTMCEPPLAPAVPIRRWWPFSSAPSKQVSRMQGKIALTRRGDCMFEDKTTLSEQSGASAVVIINDKDVLFLMSGKHKPLETAQPTAPPVPVEKAKIAFSEGDIHIPTVMLTKSDGASLLSAAHEIWKATGTLPRVRLTVSSSPMVLDTDLMGNTAMPKLRIKENVVYVVGRGQWGAVLTSTSGLDWQLFIMPRKDIDVSFSPGNVYADVDSGSDTSDLSKHVKTFWGGFTTNPVEIYAMGLLKQCPTFITVNSTLSGRRLGDSRDRSTIVLKKKKVRIEPVV